MITARMAEVIAQHDPDGGESKPTEQDYENFRQWVLNMYGHRPYMDYKRGNIKRDSDIV